MRPRHALAAGLLVLDACSRQDIGPRQSQAGSTATDPDTPERPRSSQEAPAQEKANMDDRAMERQALVRETIEARGVRDPRVLAAMKGVPRHRFIPQAFQSEAYADRPLPIVGGQTISQPYIVAFMTEAAEPAATARCLEIGTGSGYQAAVLAEVCAEVYSIEYLADVAAFGEENLRATGYGPDRVQLRVGDGYRGWPEASPFDIILVTAAPARVPEPLLDQLAIGGRLIIPVGDLHDVQILMRWRRLSAGRDATSFSKEELMGVRFVPFLGKGAAE
jgi:protein-L-isoaspartate(D-aspartate) O-methyltransferase